VIPRGKYIGERLGEGQRARPTISSNAQPVADGLTAVISAKCSSTKGRCRTRHRISCNDGRSVRN
jgi:hypothetical protein